MADLRYHVLEVFVYNNKSKQILSNVQSGIVNKDGNFVRLEYWYKNKGHIWQRSDYITKFYSQDNVDYVDHGFACEEMMKILEK
jgi:hypothetical protein